MKAQAIWGDFLDAQQIAWQLVKEDENEPLPASIN
jgi:hypothetical protein